MDMVSIFSNFQNVSRLYISIFWITLCFNYHINCEKRLTELIILCLCLVIMNSRQINVGFIVFCNKSFVLTFLIFFQNFSFIYSCFSLLQPSLE